MMNRLGRLGLTGFLTALTFGVAACGDNEPDVTVSPSLPLSVEGLLVVEPKQEVSVVGFVVIDSGEARLCMALAESFPPQCGGSFVEIVGLDDLDMQFEEAEGIRWSDPAVVLTGRYTDGTFVVDNNE